MIAVDIGYENHKTKEWRIATMTEKHPNLHSRCFGGDGKTRFNLINAQKGLYGAHMRIVKRSALGKLLSRKMIVEDHYEEYKEDGITVLHWQPKLVTQFSTLSKDQSMPECGKSISVSNNQYVSLTKSTAVQSLECPSQSGK